MNTQKWLDQFKALILSESETEKLTPDIVPLNDQPLTPHGIELLKLAASCLDSAELYCEITHYPDFALANIIANQPDVMAYSVIETIGEEDSSSIQEFVEYLLSTELSDRVMLCEQSSSDFFQDLIDLETEDKIGLLFYDANHDYQTQFLALFQVRQFLADNALIVINQNHWHCAQRSVLDFIRLHPQCKLRFDGTSDLNFLKWNGLQVLEWNQSSYPLDLTIPTISEAILEELTAAQLYQEKQELAQIWSEKMESSIQLGDLSTALKICLMLISWHPDKASFWLQKGWLYFQLGVPESGLAAACHAQRLAIQQQSTPILKKVGFLLRDNWYLQEAESALLSLLELEPNNDELYCELAFLHLNMHNPDRAAELYQKALTLNPTCEEAAYRLISCLIESSQIEEAITFSQNAILEFPNCVRIKIRACLLLPVLYRYPHEVDQHRQRFTEGLNRLSLELESETDRQRDDAFVAFGFITNFYLGYQNRNDRDLQIKYGNLLYRVMTLRFPQFQELQSIPSLEKDEKIRIGYISSYLHFHTVSKLFSNWIHGLDQERFEVYVYYLGSKDDSKIDRLKRESYSFKKLSKVIDWSAEQILEDRLHILVYLDIGMDTKTSLLAVLRLAPIQCMAWGHPITSGFANIDYFLSSELMEPNNAEEHYSEQLVRLPNLSVSYSRPELPKVEYSTRSDVLSVVTDTDIIYLSCQSMFKYLPDYDFIYPKIAQSVAQAKFVFLSHFSQKTNDLFQQRLQRAFKSVGLNSEDYCIVLPRQDKDAYLALNQISDIYLDTFAWSGGNTTFEAVACSLPIVTCPGEFMRGRHTYGILQMLGVTETIAEDEQGYIDIAVRLGLDPVWRQQIAQAVQQNQHRVFNDPTCLTALEAFYEQVVRKTDCTQDI